MKTWGTTVKAICPLTGDLKEYGGPNIKAPTKNLALDFCQQNGLGYCHIQDELIMEIPCKAGSFEPNRDNAVDYEEPGLN